VIQDAIPRIINFLKDTNVRRSATEVFTKLSEKRESMDNLRSLSLPSLFTGVSFNVIREALPHIVTLLEDDDVNIRRAAAGILTKVPKKRELMDKLLSLTLLTVFLDTASSPVHDAVPMIIKLFDNKNANVRSIGIEIFAIFFENRE